MDRNRRVQVRLTWRAEMDEVGSEDLRKEATKGEFPRRVSKVKQTFSSFFLPRRTTQDTNRLRPGQGFVQTGSIPLPPLPRPDLESLDSKAARLYLVQ